MKIIDIITGLNTNMWLVFLTVVVLAFAVATAISFIHLDNKLTTLESIPYKYLSAEQNHIVLQRGKMYRMGNRIFTVEDLPMALQTKFEDVTITDITITQVGVVAVTDWMDSSGNSIDGYIIKKR